MLTYLAIAERLKPRWLVWENVPGVLSSNGGKDFGSFLGALGELGYEWAYRVLDAQWFGVAQRRRRVFVVAHLGEGNLAAKVLFESESVCRNSAPSRETRQKVAANVEAGVGGGKWPADIASTLNAAFGSKQGLEDQHALGGAPLFVPGAICASDGQANESINQDIAPTLTKQTEQPYVYTPSSHAGYKEGIGTLRSNGGDIGGGSENLAVLYENHPNDSRVTGPHDVAPSCVSRYGTGGGNVPLVQEAIAFPATMSGTQCAKTKNLSPAICSVNQTAIAFEPGIATREGNESRFVKELSPTLRKEMGDNQVAVAFPIDTQNMTEGHASGGKGHGNNGDPSFTLTKGHSHAVAVDVYNQAIDGNTAATLTSACGGTNTSGPKAMQSMAVRRLTPKECERLQGFNDDHTLIPWRNKPADQCPDGPRYKALGNSMAVPCMAWIGKRIDAVERNMK
jgi:DNA (cytosine-5)-methyltransferase 1